MPSYIGHIIEDNVSGKRGLIVDQKQWTYDTGSKEYVTRYHKEDTPVLDFFVHWFDGDTFWIASENITIITN